MNEDRNLKRLTLSGAMRSLVCGAVALIAAGCGDGDVGTGKFSPTAVTARQALVEALDAWKRGEPQGKLTGTATTVEVVDSKRQAGQKLVSYEIVDEASDGSAKRFSVRLMLENPKQVLATEYVVVGLDPLWVFGKEDYAQEKGM